MKFLFHYLMLLYILMILIGFFGILKTIAMELCHEVPFFWLSLILIIGGAIGYTLVIHSYYKVKKFENAK